MRLITQALWSILSLLISLPCAAGEGRGGGRESIIAAKPQQRISRAKQSL